MPGFLALISALFGWVYVLAWSASFYPQPLLNYTRRSTSGTTVDFPLVNILGFAALLVSNAAFYYSPVIREQYAARHPGHTPTVAFNDIAFALHAFIISFITTSQYLAAPLWGFPSDPGVRPSRFILGVSAGCFVGCLATYFVVLSASPPGVTVDPRTDWCALDVIYAIGYVKVLVTLIKYAPQAIANWRNKSTTGWSIWQILLDLLGGVLSLVQQGIDSYLQRDWSGVTGNPVKFALGNIALFYDTVFIVQHYVLYGDESGRKRRDGGQNERSLTDEERRLD